MQFVELQYDMSRLQKTMKLYYGLSSKSEAAVVRKQSKELDYNIRVRLKDLSPARGSIRSEQLAAMRATKGRGVKVRESVIQAVAEKYGLLPFHEASLMRKRAGGKQAKMLRGLGVYLPSQNVSTVKVGGKRLNFRALAVKRELGLRESGIGFMSISTPATSDGEGVVETDSKYGTKLSEYVLETSLDAEEKYALLRWVGGKGTALEGMSKPQQQSAIDMALNDRIDDMIKHMSDRVGFDVKEAGLV